MIDSSGQNLAVDAGVAAVLGAAIGGGLAGLTAVGTSWFNLRVARLQHEAQETEAARQRRFEVLRERREPRSMAYSNFLSEGQEVIDIVRSRLGEADLKDELLPLLKRLQKQRANVAVVGPQPAADAAFAFLKAFAEFRIEFCRDNPDAWKKAVKAEALLEQFTLAVRAVLEDDGSRPQ
ncbi:hypothetical protein [Streptomyces aurantiogriseus]|uniref:hypothetical protein n=1 Tax=Streptomyces aurantiogriseus TaxID=66870 RepID=UPI001E2A0838|nr:hypothetical protein [Streptomyces aurantiogriseus]